MENLETKNSRPSNLLLNDLIRFSKGFKKSSYLEIDFGEGDFISTLSPHFRSCYGIDLSQDNFNNLNRMFVEKKFKNSMVFCGDSSRIPMNKYDVVLIGKNKSYKEILIDTINVISKNINQNPFLIVYNGYGILNSGANQFCDKFFKDFMLVIGDKKQSEAVACAFDLNMKKKYLEILKNEYEQ